MADCGAQPEHSIVIGDTGWDMGMARSSGAFAIGALWGYHGRDELAEAGAHLLANDPGDVLALAEQLVEQAA
jgi:phosphoglycolate phosphatase